MANQQLIDYVKGQMVAGTSETDIRKILKDAGWPDTEIEDAVKGAKPSVATSPVAASPLTGVSVASAQPAKTAEPVKAEVKAEPAKSFDFMSNPSGLSTFNAAGTTAAKPKEVKQAEAMPMAIAADSSPKSSKLPWIVAGVAVIAMVGVGIYFYMGNSTLSGQVDTLTSANAGLSAQINQAQNSGTAAATDLDSIKKDLAETNSELNLFVIPPSTSSTPLQAAEVSISGSLSSVKGQFALTTGKALVLYVKNFKDAKVDAALKTLVGTQVTLSGSHLPGTFELAVTGLNGSALPELAVATSTAPAATSTKPKSSASATTTPGL